MSDNLTIKNYETKVRPTWCPGCGNFTIWLALRQALVRLNLRPWEVAITFGIGCNSNGANFIEGYRLHSLHGRPVPCAEAIRWSNHKLKAVIAIGGDGDGFGIGLSHFLHACRRNVDILYLTHDNQIYGLTTGQVSPTTSKGMKTKSTPFGSIDEPLNPAALAITNGATFVARGFAGETEHLTNLIVAGIKHRGFSLVDVFQPCVTFNTLNTFDWFRKRVYKLETTDYKPEDKELAWKKSWELGEKIPVGILYEEQRELDRDQLPQLAKEALVEKSLAGINLEKAMLEYR
jgi:2-oxoglutarate/2-oxoacid ferredoxin oxidoreductase subunit beta